MCSYTKIHEWQTRLALIKPSEDPSAYLELSLVVVDLVDLNTGAIINHDTLVTYDALSYAWGTASPSAKCICDGNTILLRDNLDSALKYLRKPQDERYVWIDFLCINQDDLVEKAVQIPRMKNIFSKASTVIVWLGESLAVASILGECQKSCGSNVGTLTCLNHRKEAWKSILDYAWFRRTWVRQEVFAAEKLNIRSPYFSTSWELFNEALPSLLIRRSWSPFERVGVQNLTSLNKLYSSRQLELLDLLKQGKHFQASVPHDHVFSVLGMASTPKRGTKGMISVTYDKSYREVCGDVTRYIIETTKSINILRLCTWQEDRSYAFDWPKVVWSPPKHDQLKLRRYDLDGEFDFNKSLARVPLLGSSYNTDSPWISSQSVSKGSLVLYGRVWGTLTATLDDVAISVLNRDGVTTRKVSVPAYSIDHDAYKSPRTEPPLRRDLDVYRELVISKSSGLGRIFPKIIAWEFEEDVLLWRCYGRASKGDIFVSLEPDPQNVILRRCLGSRGVFEVVGWHVPINAGPFNNNGALRWQHLDFPGHLLGEVAGDILGPRERFEIR